MHLWLQNKQILFGGCCSILSNSIHSITGSVSGLHFRTIRMPSVYMLIYNTRYCVFQKWCLSDYFHETEVLSCKQFACCFGISLCRIVSSHCQGGGGKSSFLMELFQMLFHTFRPAFSFLFEHQFHLKVITCREMSFVSHIFEVLCYGYCVCIAQVLLVKKSDQEVGVKFQWNVYVCNVLKHFPYCKTRKLQFLENTGGKVARSDIYVIFGLNHFFELYIAIIAFCKQIGQVMCYENH